MWASSALILVMINVIIIQQIGSSLYRSILGMLILAVWLGAWYIFLKTLAYKIVEMYALRHGFMLRKADKPSKA